MSSQSVTAAALLGLLLFAPIPVVAQDDPAAPATPAELLEAAKERQEKTLIESYLPEPLSAEEMERVVSEAIAEKKASSLRDMGSVMKEAMTRLQATGKTVDGKAVSSLVRAR